MPATLPWLNARLLAHFGPQHWWPAKSRFEVMVGAILTQNTAWSNVEKAIANLRRADLLSVDALLAVEPLELAEKIRPAGYFNVKTRRLQAFCRWYREQGAFAALQRLETGALRHALLSVHGIGPETADDILLYAFERPVFVIDAYTRRLFSRLALIGGDEPYEQLRAMVEACFGTTPAQVKLFNELHALIVAHAKDYCRKRPCCTGCPLARRCPSRE